MNAEEYAAATAAVVAAMVATVLQLARLFRSPALTPVGWERLLDLIYPYVEDSRRQAAELGRRFYDAQRERHRPDLPRHNAYLAEYRREWFSEAMYPARQAMLRPGAPESAVVQVALRAAKEAENGGRRTILRAVEEDRVAKGWARVATGRETCEFCLALISRGPVYHSAEGAGLDADDTTAQALFEAGDDEALAELMVKWHAGCDCKVVPVFDRQNWPGLEEARAAEALWIRFSELVDNDPTLRKPQNGNQHGPNDREWTRSEAIMAAIRRALDNGDIAMTDYAVAA